MWDVGGDDEGDEGENRCTRGGADVWQCRERIHGEVRLASSLDTRGQGFIQADSCFSPDTVPVKTTLPKSPE